MKERYDYADIAKGIGIILMIVGHTGAPRFITNWIYAFHMPLFFILSGVLTNWLKEDVIGFCKNKTRSLLVPFMLYSATVLFVDNCMINSEITGGGGSWLINGWVDYALWFIPVLFFALIITKFLYAIKFQYLRVLCLLILLVLGYVLSYKDCILPWSFSSVPYATLLVFIGSKIKDKIDILHNMPSYYILAFAAIVMMVSSFCRLDIAWNKILPIVPITFAAVVGVCMVVLIAMKISDYKRGTLLKSILITVGRNTFPVVAYSQLIIITFNFYGSYSPLVKYSVLVIVLISFTFVKNKIISLLNTAKIIYK